jgi:alkanesulfonate monooxygenase SsuD/methylene tetrahydromethanopterin reductase-like flavin-dependent oxidoreductase (luciferase family)
VTGSCRWPGLVAGFTLASLLCGCAGSSRTDDDYREKVANTAEAIQGLIGTVQVAVSAAARDHIPAPYLSVTLAEADDDASAVADQLDSRQPPSAAADELRDRLDELLEQTVSTLDDLRIAVRRGEIDKLAALAKPLTHLDAKLQEIADLDQ